MNISKITLSNFRSFSEVPTDIVLADLTTLVGSNACGKTAVLAALTRLFGVSSTERAIQKSDFHVRMGTDPAEVHELCLYIEARIELPELADPSSNSRSVPECFRQMLVDGPRENLYCRIRLEAKWTRSTLPEGEIEEALYWIKTPEAEVEQHQKTKVKGVERSRIHVIYVPAARDPLKQLRQASGTLIHRLLAAIRWSNDVRQKVEVASKESNEAFRSERGVEVIEKTINRNWIALHDFAVLKNVHLRAVSPQFEDLLKRVEMVFSPGEGCNEQPAER